MKIIYPGSLARTLDNLNEFNLLGKTLSNSQKMEVANWISELQGKPGCYANMFAPTPKDYENGFRVFTGELVDSRAAIGHILGEEACRALLLLKVKSPNVKKSLGLATQGISQRIIDSNARGFYCCGICTCAYWRHLTAGGLKEVVPEKQLESGIKQLKEYRKGAGQWRRFPFHYTLLALSEIELPSAHKEIRYALPTAERYLKFAAGKDSYTLRRRLLIEKVLNQFS